MGLHKANSTSFKKGIVPHNKGKAMEEWMSPSKVEKMKNMFKVHKPDPEHITRVSKANCKPVAVIDNNDNIISTYECISFAAIYHNVSVSSICAVLKGRRSHTRGLRFRYLTSEEVSKLYPHLFKLKHSFKKYHD